MITENYVSFKIAKLLKEKGFSERSYGAYNLQGEFQEGYGEWNKTSIYYAAPTHQMAREWIRNEYNFYIEVFVTWKNKIPHYQWRINNLITQDTIVDTPCLEKPEQAVEAALLYVLKNLI